jgi:hypothetical protein
MIDFEDFVTEQVLDGRSIVDLYSATKDETKTNFARWQKEKDS